MTLGELRMALAALDPEAKIMINFGEPTVPTGIESWRGAYSEASITYDRNRITDEDITVQGMIDMIDESYTRIHYGYKGGEYTFDANTRVWIAEHGWSGNCGIDRVIDMGWMVLIQPGFQEY